MSENERRYFSGNTLEQALMQAASHFGVRPDELSYKQLEKKHGFLRKRRGVIIEVDPESPVVGAREGAETAPKAPPTDTEGASPETPGPDIEAAASVELQEAEPEQETEEESEEEPEYEPVPSIVDEAGLDEETEPAKEAEQQARGPISRAIELDDELVEVAGKALEEVFEASGLSLEFEVSAGDERLEIELQGDDQELLLEDRGSLLLAIQHLMPRLIRGLCGRSAPCRVDADDFHASHESELQDLARRVASEVRNRLEPRTLHPMNPAERRIIHVTLADEADIDTESQGRGFFKRVTIRPIRRRPRGFDRYS